MSSKISNHRLIAALVALMLPTAAYADDTDAEARIRELEKQMQAMSQELIAVQQQLAQSKEARVEEKGKSQGSPVYAAFKDGITFEDGSGNWKLAINGRVQADYRTFSPDVDAADTYSIRRARLGGTLTFYKDFVARVEGEYSAAAGTTLTYGYVDINKFPAAKVRLGQFKPLYGLERAMSTNFIDFQERSMADALLGSTFDRGVMVFGTPITGINYSLAMVNGTGTSDENNVKNDGKDTTLRLTANAAEWAGWKDAVVHIGGFYADGNQGSRRLAGVIPTGQTEGRGLQFFSTACSGGTIPALAGCPTATATGAATTGAFADNVKRTRSGLETALAYGPVKLQGEFINTKFDGPGYSREIDAWYTSAVWNVTGESFASMYKEGIFGRLKPKNNYKGGGDGWGALQIGGRYSKFDASDFKTSNNPGTGVLLNPLIAPRALGLPSGAVPVASLSDGLVTATNEADAWTVGANWILNPNVRLVANWVRTNYDTPVTVRVNGVNKTFDDEDAFTLRAQFDF